MAKQLPPKFQPYVEQVLVETPAQRIDSDRLNWPGVELTAEERRQTKTVMDLYTDQRNKARELFRTRGREAFRTELRKIREDFHRNLTAIVGVERAERIKEGIRREAEQEGVAGLQEALNAATKVPAPSK